MRYEVLVVKISSNGSSPLLRKAPSTVFFRLLILSSLIIASTVDALSSKLSHRLVAPDDNNGVELASSDQLVLGVTGTIASLIMIYSEYTLKTTGCGLPAGPFGLVGLIEGLSYLGVTGIAAYAVVAKVRTVRMRRRHCRCFYKQLYCAHSTIFHCFPHIHRGAVFRQVHLAC
jgi:predicted neutral ceramidase superfamily lipid hydrolase